MNLQLLSLAGFLANGFAPYNESVARQSDCPSFVLCATEPKAALRIAPQFPLNSPC